MRKRMRGVAIILAVTLGIASTAGCGNQTGVTMPSTEQKEASAASSGTKTGDLEGKWLCGGYRTGGDELDMEQLAASGMTLDVYLDLKADGSGVLSMFGNDTEIACKDGKVSAFGQDLYTYEMKDADTMVFDMMGAVYTFLREGSEAAEALQNSGGSASVATASADGSDEVTYSKKPNRHLMSTETEYEVDGGVLYYETYSDGVEISYGNVYADELKIPEEIEGKPVYAIRRLHGNIKNLYVPKTLKRIYGSFGDFEGCEKLVVGYDSDDCDLEFFSQGGCEYGHFLKEDLKEVSFSPSMKDNEDITLKLNVMGGAFQLEKVENMPPIWEEGYQSLVKAEKMLSDPGKYIKPQSEKVQKLTDEVTAGAASDTEKLFLISQWVCDNVSYDDVRYLEWKAVREARYYGADWDYKNSSAETDWVEPDDVIDHKATVCEGYAKLTRAMCNAAGIPAVYVMGIIPPKVDLPEPHAWNMVYVDGAWTHIDNTFSDKDYNKSITLDEDGELYAVETNEDGDNISREMYESNPELQEDYTWEEIEAINQATEEKYSFKNEHDYFCLPALAMGANHIAWEVEGMPIE